MGCGLSKFPRASLEAAPISETRHSTAYIKVQQLWLSDRRFSRRKRKKMAAKRRPSMSWKTDTIKREEVINKELTMQINNRKRMSSHVYGDLNYLLVNKDHLSKLTASKEQGHDATSKLVIKPKEATEAIQIAITTGCCSFGTRGSGSKDKLLEFVEKLFKLTSEQLAQGLKIVEQQPPPKLHLMCKVLKATELKAKDGNQAAHYRSPYCRLGILNMNHLEESTGSEFKFLSEWQKTGAVSEVVTTSSNLEPVWNEDVKLSVENIEEDLLVIELWDDVQQDKRKNLKALISQNKEEFMSWMTHSLSVVPVSGYESRFPLKSRNKRTHKGFITLFMSIQADSDKPLEVSLHEHHILTRALINEGSKSSDGSGHQWNWNGDLSSDSERLLHYHGALNGLNKLQLLSVRLSELLKYHRKLYGIDTVAFHKLVVEVKKMERTFLADESTGQSIPHVGASSSSPVPHVLHEVSPQMQHSLQQWEKQMFSDLNKLESELMDMMNDHIRLVQFGYDGKLENVYSLLSTLSDLYSIGSYVQRMAPDRELSTQIENSIEPAVKSWFTLLKSRVMPSDGREQSELRDLCSHCLIWTEKAREQLHPKCKEVANVDYFTHYLVNLDALLSPEVVRCLEQYKEAKVETYTFEIYTNFQHLFELSKHIYEAYREKLSFLDFHKWFEEFVPGWIKLSREKCESRIEQAIQLDEIVKITNELSLSSSAVDTKGFLHQMANFWQHVNWPVASEAYGYAVSMIENICCCAELYVRKLFASLGSESLRDEHGRFKASEKLCLVLNNMYYVREFLAELPTHMDLNNFYARLEREDKVKGSFDTVGASPGCSACLTVRAKSLIGNFVTNADEGILKMVDDVARKICSELSPDIQAFVSKVVKRKVEDESKVMDPLFEYLSENLTTLGNNLLPSVFESITASLWDVTVAAVDQLSRIPRKKDVVYHRRLLDTLTSLRDFYYCEGQGVSGRALDSDAYLKVKERLNILRLSTGQLIDHFYSDLLQHQQDENGKEKQVGELVVSVGYIKEMSAVEVNVVQARDVGELQEPYVKLRLSSMCKFADRHWKTLPVKGGKKAPSFSEEFNLPVTQEEMRLDSTMILFYLVDKQSKGKSHVGMCAVACKDIPQLSQASLTQSISDPFAPQRRNLTLPLFRFSSETLALDELTARTDYKDAGAAKFMKMNELLLGHIVNSHSPKIGRLRSKTD